MLVFAFAADRERKLFVAPSKEIQGMRQGGAEPVDSRQNYGVDDGGLRSFEAKIFVQPKILTVLSGRRSRQLYPVGQLQ
jgi:hypothetical protein